MVDHSEWFEQPDSVLSQGDILVGVDVYLHQPGEPEPVFSVQTTNAVVLTQTCDIPKASQQTVLLAEIDSYDDVVARRGNGQDGKKWRKKLVDNEGVADFLIPPCPSVGLGWSLANFRELFILPKVQFEGDPLRSVTRAAIASPYREHLSQAYARFVMRVGLPNTLHDFVDHAPPS